MGMLFKYLASVLIHLPAEHCASPELTRPTPRIAALPNEENLGLCYWKILHSHFLTWAVLC